MITALDSKVMDANSEALGVGVERLMGNAGKALAGVLVSRYHGKRFLIVCGHGNNGGDGFAAAAAMGDEKVAVRLIGDPARIRSDAARHFYSALKPSPKPFDPSEGDYDVLVDAVLGTGARGDLRPDVAEFVRFANSFKGAVVSVDVPTGLGASESVRPNVTVTMHDVKEGMDRANSGEIVITDIGIPDGAVRCTGPGDLFRYPIPKKDSHKGSNGRLLVIGGGPYFGAPAMAALGAMRVGADLVTVATPEASYHEVACQSPALMVRRLSGDVLCKDHVKDLLELAEPCDAVLIGPGLGRAKKTESAVREFVTRYGGPLVIDADGLDALGDDFRARSRETILTPHMGEYKGLGGKKRDLRDVAASASRMGCTVLLKGPEDLISDGEGIKVNRTGTPGMTSGGTGDVLAGIVAGLLCKGTSAFDAACLGAYLSGKAGERAFSKNSYGMIATDVLAAVPKVLRNGLDRLGI